MIKKIRYKLKKTLRVGQAPFTSYGYYRHNQRRQEHLATLGLDLHNKSVLEVGAGIGDHTSFFVDRGCSVVSTDARQENLTELKSRYPEVDVHLLDMDAPDKNVLPGRRLEIVYCYGLLYHLKNPVAAIDYMAEHCEKMLLLETQVSWGSDDAVHLVKEAEYVETQSFSGTGCRPTRLWVMNQLKRHFPHVYMPITQPNNPEFPLDWTGAEPPEWQLTRAVFIATRDPLDNPGLVTTIPMKQVRAS